MKIRHAFLAVTLGTCVAQAHPGGHGDPLDAGRDSPAVSARTIAIEMTDKGCKPAEVAVQPGEMIRFTAKNATATARELAVGPAEDLKAHAEMVRKHPGMQGGKGSRIAVKAGGSAQLGWKASKAGRYAISCAAPGQFETASAGQVVVGKP